MKSDEPRAWLVPLSGPTLQPVEIAATPDGCVLGRGEGCALRLPADADKVSRQHARFTRRNACWRIADLGSRWGTFLNGVKLTPQRDVSLGEGDLLRIAPWTFHFSTYGVPRRGLLADDDTGTHGTMIRSYVQGDDRAARPLAEDLLTLLLESAAAIHAAGTELALAEALIDAARRGTGLSNAAVLRPLDAAGRVEVIAARQGPLGANAAPGFSRSLLAAASQGVVAELSGNMGADISQSIVQMQITAAMCVPLMLGGAVAAYLYLDSRGGAANARAARPGAAAFCLAMGRMAGLALANLKRVEIERRQAEIEFDLSAAAKAQKWIFPQRVTHCGALTCTGESRPGAYVGGDFFDVVPLDEHRAAVALGDVSGHGVAASVLMTAAQGFLHAALRHNPDVAAAVSDLNRFVCPRRVPASFLTLWVGVFDMGRRQLTYVNAGHGYALLANADGTFTMLDGGQDFPIGFEDDSEYRSVTVQMTDSGRALVISDGIVEQTCSGPDASREQFGLERVKSALASAGQDDVIASIFNSVVKHAQTSSLQDDATAVMVEW